MRTILFFLLISISIHLYSNECEKFKLTTETYTAIEFWNINEFVVYGENYTVADWNDLKNLDWLSPSDCLEWINCMGIKENQTFIVTYDGKDTYSGSGIANQQYFVKYSKDYPPIPGKFPHGQLQNLYLFSGYPLPDSTRILTKYIDVTSVQSSNFLSINIYPNPVKKILFLNMKYSGKIYNVYGQQVYSFNCQSTIDFIGFEKGIYFLVIQNEGNFFNYKIVKE
ncbi:T9SS type A sorting domain-containing protein [Saccharicrinis sp. FJH54]|uniref:T9SS type A sorting domain-containing protein n=1 Tax=Saccharicrinis sp. FJH54 TaxID=3344665 RepID=UPI0035D402AF